MEQILFLVLRTSGDFFLKSLALIGLFESFFPRLLAASLKESPFFEKKNRGELMGFPNMYIYIFVFFCSGLLAVGKT